MTANNQLIKTQTDQLKKYLNAFKPNYQSLLGDEEKMGKLMATFDLAYHRFPLLLSCTPYSIAKCAMAAAMTNIMPDGTHAHLVPFGKEAVYMVDWKGYAKNLNGSNYIKNIYADVVYKGDDFKVFKGSDKRIEHEAKYQSDEVIFYYAYIEYVDGVQDFEVMTPEQIEVIKNNYSASVKKGIRSPWTDNKESAIEMGKKTVGHRLLKRVPLPDQIQTAVEFDHQAETRGKTEILGLTEEMLPEDERPLSKTEKLAEKVTGAKETTAEELPEEIDDSPEDVLTAETLATLIDVLNTKLADGSLPQEKYDEVDEVITKGEMTQSDAEALILRFSRLKPPVPKEEKKPESEKKKASPKPKVDANKAKIKELKKAIIQEQERLRPGSFQEQAELLSVITKKKYVDVDQIPDGELEDVLKLLKAKEN